MKFYFVMISDICGYDLMSTGKTPKEAINNAWKHYKESGNPDFTSKKEWLEWHGICEGSCQERTIGDAWYE